MQHGMMVKQVALHLSSKFDRKLRTVFLRVPLVFSSTVHSVHILPAINWCPMQAVFLPQSQCSRIGLWIYCDHDQSCIH